MIEYEGYSYRLNSNNFVIYYITYMEILRVVNDDVDKTRAITYCYHKGDPIH
jgi:hypothetical protein